MDLSSHWLAPGEHSTLALVASLVAMLCTSAFALLHPSRGATTSWRA